MASRFFQILQWLQRLLRTNSATVSSLPSQFQGATPENIPESGDYYYCLAGNIKESFVFGEEKALRHGTKHFSGGTKVYCAQAHWGDGYEFIKVIGMHRKSKRLMMIIMPSKFITNWRLQKVYTLRIRQMMDEHGFWYENTPRGKNDIEGYVNFLKKWEAAGYPRS